MQMRNAFHNSPEMDFESFDTCESCLLGKMTKSLFTHKGERAKELLGLIHTDVCGPFSTSARGGYLYFITLLMISVDMDLFI